MKKSTKSNNSTSFKLPVSKNVRDTDSPTSPWLEDYQDFFTGSSKPVTHAFLERLSQEIIEYAEKTDMLKLEWFFTQKRIPPMTGRRWSEKYEQFGKAYETAKLIIGMRREHGALNKNLSESMVIRRQHAYDPEWEADRLRDKQDKIDISKANLEALERPANIILGQLPGLEEYKKQIQDKNEE